MITASDFTTKGLAGRIARHGQFYIDDPDSTQYPGYSFGLTWNGWACPFFSYDVAQQIIADFVAEGGEGRYDDASDSFRLQSADESYAVTGIDIETPDGSQRVYPIGAGMWIWDDAND